MSQKILITGGAGYIGSHVVNILGKEGYDLTIVDNLSTGRKESILYGGHVNLDLADYAALSDLLESGNFDGIMHFAGSIVVPESVDNPLKYYRNNTINSLNLIELAVKHGVKNFIFSSSAAVYGNPSSGQCSEETETNPINPYGRTKLMTEWTLKDVADSSGLNFVALRYFNVAGASLDGKIGQCSEVSTHLIKIACETALGKREKMSLYGTDYDTPDGTCIRDYIHVDDLAMAHKDALSYLGKNQESLILNCGYGQGYSVKEVIEMVKKVSGVDFKVEVSGRRAGDPPELTARADKIKEKLDWTPQHANLELMVRTALDWEKKLG
ncbi:MAG: UDP-glucose 4-epimerase GalE [Halobacteriovoraceae bacterium]|jgi:UDP-glucose 4-epimerase|nr:UDP-glucose 4-epimerase GalE [Halobacteriovoraceae bacterium]MBT5093412.1 UDP-glucose 4-epimerase GalE [Halobacteriovoraceae bacterium]